MRSGNVTGMTTATLLNLRQIGELIGVEYRTIRYYHQTAERRRRENKVRPGDMPKPDDRLYGITPVWKKSTVDAWVRRRPGRGVGGGRPRVTRADAS